MFDERIQSTTSLVLLTSLALLVGCASAIDAPPPSIGKARAGLVASHTITVYRDGSFSPPTLQVSEGDSVTFVGQPGIAGLLPLRTTDAIVQSSQADIDAATASGTACMTSTFPYTITHVLPGDDNELTGPLRRGTSGIYALGPEDASGSFEGPAADTCEDIGAAAGASPAVQGETWETYAVTGAATKLCSKYRDGKRSKVSNSRFVLESTWNNPDITGAVIRINWKDLYTQTLVGDVETYTKDYSKLDTELESASKRGKLVLLEILAGDGIPPWLFSDHVPLVDATATGLAAKSVVPIQTSDFGTSSDTDMPTANSCGYDKTLGSPADPGYKAALLESIRDVATHIRLNAQHYQSLGSLKVTGLNFLTGEMRLPKRCLDPAVTNPNGHSQSTCWCNTRIWATPLGTPVAAYDANPSDPAAPMVTGGGYTSLIAQNFVNAIEHAIYVELGRRKTMHYMLIQDGFPKVADASHFHMDSGAVAPNLGYVDAAGAAIAYDQQTVDALDSGQLGNFRRINADGSPNLAAGGDPDASALFAVMHAGLGPIPVSPQSGLNHCLQPLPTTVVDGKVEGTVVEPGVMPTNLHLYSSGGCPNKWAAREGYQGQIVGYQTQNDLDSTDDLSAALWNATLNSNAVFVEAYEGVLWRAEQERYVGSTVLSTSVAGYSSVPERQKSLGDWTRELHKRRRTIAGFALNAATRHMKDPFPDSYTFTFRKPLPTGTVESHFFINPAARCASGTLASGRIDVTGI